MRATLKATTAILASLTLVIPANLSAQIDPATGVATETPCIDGTAAPCAEIATDAVPEPETPTEQPAETESDLGSEEPEAAPDTAVTEEIAQPEDQPAPEEPTVGEPLTEEEVAPAAEVAEPVVESTEGAIVEEPATEPAAQPEVVTDSKPIESEPEVVKETAPATEPAADAPSGGTQTAVGDGAAPVQPTVPTTGDPSEAAAALATADDPDAGEMETETITEETARSSDEDFTGRINSEAGAAAETGDGGLSKFEKALLLGAGALAVGAIVRGNREVVGTSQDRLVVSGRDGNLEVLKDDNALLRQPGSQVQTRTFDDGSTRTVTTRADGSQVITVRDADLRVIRRVLVRTDGSEVMLIDDTARFEPVDVSRLPPPAPDVNATGSESALRAALERQGAFDRQFSLAQIRQISEVRKLAPSIDVDTITFETGSAAIRPEQARGLTELGTALVRLIAQNPNEVFLVEGHTDAVGSASTNLILSDRRAESLALALTEYFAVPPENLVVQGYGESDLRVATDTAERANRRAGVRRITQLMQVAAR